jgi:hypothetical protein
MYSAHYKLPTPVSPSQAPPAYLKYTLPQYIASSISALLYLSILVSTIRGALFPGEYGSQLYRVPGFAPANFQADL